jgi:ABC-2 type transport system permease protein
MTAFTVPAPGRAARMTRFFTARRFLTALGDEVCKGLLFAWSEKLQIAMEFPFFVVMILLLGPMLLVAFIPFMFFYMKSVKLFWRLLAEIQTGTIEQVYQSPLPSWLVAAAGRLVAAIIETLILTGMVYGLVSGFVTLHFHWTLAGLLRPRS